MVRSGQIVVSLDLSEAEILFCAVRKVATVAGAAQ
jgi:hypothetical protein